LQPPVVADATQQRFERTGAGEIVCQFHVGVGDMCFTLFTQDSLAVFSRVCCVVRVVHKDDMVIIAMPGKDDG
jgi:hypothetical protein